MTAAAEASTDQLLQQLKRGRVEALDMLYPRFGGRLYAFARAVSAGRLPHEDLEELVNETMHRIVRGIRTYDERRSSEAWILGICRNVTIDHLRRRNLPTLSLDLIDEASALRLISKSIEELLDVRQIAHCFAVAWQRLSIDIQNVLRNPPLAGPRGKRFEGGLSELRLGFQSCYQQTG